MKEVQSIDLIYLTHGEHNSEKSVETHENERVDADVAGGVDQILDGLAPYQTERPMVEDVVRGRGGHAKDDEEEVSQGQV